MSDKKHIDRIFQEKLKDFEVAPNPNVWENIQNQLDQNNNKNKKAFPLWARLASIAALLLLLFTIGNNVLNNNNSETNSNKTVVDTNENPNSSDSKANSTNKTILDSNQDTPLTNEEGLVSEDSNSTESNNSDNFTNSNLTNIVNPKSSQLNTTASNQNNSNITTTKTQRVLNNKSYSNKTQNRVVTNNDSKDKLNRITKTSSVLNDSDRNQVVYNQKDKDNASTLANNPNKKYSKDNRVTSISNSDPTDISNNSIKNPSNSVTPEFDEMKAKEVLENLNNTTQDAVVDNSGVTKDQILQDKNTETTEASEEKDSPSIEEEIAKAKDIIEEEKEKVNRWQVYANIAPVYYNTLGKGSHIDDQFVNNNKSGEFNTSYGVNVSYAFNERLSLRTGFNSLKLSYDTDDVIIYENVDIDIDPNSNPLRNLVFAETTNGSNQLAVSAISQENLIVQQFNGTLGNNFESALSQRLGFYEIPLELKYRLINKRFGVNVIGGVSTFILNDNEVYSEFENRKRYIGETNNVNDVSFSGNLGLGIDYEFSKKVKLNIEPTFKYQFNAYENTSGNFRPYIVGIYTGLSYKF